MVLQRHPTLLKILAPWLIAVCSSQSCNSYPTLLPYDFCGNSAPQIKCTGVLRTTTGFPFVLTLGTCQFFSSSIPDAVVFRAGFNRLNLHYEVVQKPDGDVTAELARLIKTRFANQSGIVYCFPRKDCEEVAAQLRRAGIRAAFYHADMDSSRRTAVHEKWVSGKYNVIVATVAFG